MAIALGSNIKNVIFDFGGVLIDWNPRHMYRKVFKDPVEMERFITDIVNQEWNTRHDAGLPFAEGIAQLSAVHPEYAKEIQLFFDRWEEMLGDVIRENVEWLPVLKAQGYGVYGLTNWSAETFPIALQKYDFWGNFDGILVSGEEKLAKPDPRIFQLLLDRYQLKADECLFIDDNQVNLDAAASLGIHTYLYKAAL